MAGDLFAKAWEWEDCFEGGAVFGFGGDGDCGAAFEGGTGKRPLGDVEVEGLCIVASDGVEVGCEPGGERGGRVLGVD